MKDPDGKLVVVDLIRLGMEQGEGWDRLPLAEPGQQEDRSEDGLYPACRSGDDLRLRLLQGLTLAGRGCRCTVAAIVCGWVFENGR